VTVVLPPVCYAGLKLHSRYTCYDTIGISVSRDHDGYTKYKIERRSMKCSLLLIMLLSPCACCLTSFEPFSACARCSTNLCQINVGLLGNLTSVDKTAIYETLSVMNSATVLHPEWEIQMYVFLSILEI